MGVLASPMVGHLSIIVIVVPGGAGCEPVDNGGKARMTSSATVLLVPIFRIASQCLRVVLLVRNRFGNVG